MDTTKPPGHLILRRELLPPDVRELIVRAAARTGRPLQAAEELGYSPRSYTQTLEHDSQFAADIEAAKLRKVETLEEAADMRAVDGWEEPVFQLGQEVGTVRKYSDTLLLRRLEALAPERYRANVRVDARVAAGVLVVPSTAPDAAAWAAAFNAPSSAAADDDPSRR